MATSQRRRAVAQCPECPGRVRRDGVERVCVECGLVVATDDIDHGPEWRQVDRGEGDDPKRVNRPNPGLADGNLGSEIGRADERGPDSAHLQWWHARSRLDRSGRSYGYAGGEIQRIGTALGIGSHAIDTSKRLFRELQDAGLVLGRSLDTLAATCVYTATRVDQQGRVPADVAHLARDTDADVLARRHTWLCDELGIPCPPPDPRQRARRIGAELGVDEPVIQRAIERIDAMDGAARSRGSPTSVAAAALYVVSPFTQADVAEAAGCSTVSIRKRQGEVRVG